LQFGLIVPQILIFFIVRSSHKAGDEKKLSIYSLWPSPFNPFAEVPMCGYHVLVGTFLIFS
jgi:hypothetical protein